MGRNDRNLHRPRLQHCVGVLKYRLTNTLEDSVINRSKEKDIKLLAYEALARQKADGKHFVSVYNWTGKHLVLRTGKDAVSLEIIP